MVICLRLELFLAFAEKIGIDGLARANFSSLGLLEGWFSLVLDVCF